MRRSHDSHLKKLYRAGTRDALALFLPRLAATIDWNHWEWIDKEIPIVGDRRSSVIADLVGLTRDVRGRHLRLLVHPELQMRTDALMGWRALLYNAGLVVREGDPQTRVITVVFYHCPGLGGVRQQRFDLDYYHVKSLLGVTYWSVGLGELDAERYARKQNPMGWALASWMRQRQESRVELRLRLVEKILRSVQGEEYQELLLDTVQSYYKLSRQVQRREEQLLRSRRYGEVDEMIQTLGERRDARVRREAEAAAMRDAVQQAIRIRFPDAPASLIERIERIRSRAALRDLLARAIRAASAEEIEASLPA